MPKIKYDAHLAEQVVVQVQQQYQPARLVVVQVVQKYQYARQVVIQVQRQYHPTQANLLCSNYFGIKISGREQKRESTE